MPSKSDKDKRSAGKTTPVSGKDSDKKTSSKSKKQVEEDDDEDDIDDTVDDVEEAPTGKKAAKSPSSGKKSEEEDDDDVAEEEEKDEWEKVEEEEEWDPDFDEFDVPKSKGKKAAGVEKKEEEDFKIDDDFKDLFNDKDYDDEEEDY